MKRHNLLNKKFNSLSVLEYLGQSYWLCKCDCGNIKKIKAWSLTSGETKTCGCSKIRNEIGKKYGKLTVIEKAGLNKYRGVIWKCRCDCGNIKAVAGSHLRCGSVKSCDCLKKLKKGQAAINLIYRSYKNNAKNNGRDFTIQIDDFIKIISKNCHYCNAKPNTISGKSRKRIKFNGQYLYNGIDRIDNRKGYPIKNVVPCCKICNRAKNNMTYDDFVLWIKRLKQNSKL